VPTRRRAVEAGEGLPDDRPEQLLGPTIGDRGPGLVDVRVAPVGVDGEEAVRDALVDPAESPLGPFALPSGAAPGHRVPDPVDQELVLFGAGLLLEVVGHPGRDGLARDPLAALPGEQDEREVGVLLADGLEELDAVHAWHVVVRDDAVDGGPLELFEARGSARHRPDAEGVVDALEVAGGHLAEIRVVVHVEDPHRLVGRLQGALRVIPIHTLLLNPTTGSTVEFRSRTSSLQRPSS